MTSAPTVPHLSRRALLAGGLAAGLISRVDARSGPAAIDTLPTVAEMEAHTRALAAAYPKLVETQVLGTSRNSRPIELISIGKGEKSALIVGAPHPNEPIGCAMIERLLDRLVRDATLREESGYRWHFIKAIDIDGVALNEGWFKAPRTPRNYLRHFFRPAFAQQPDYTFPLEVDGYRFDQPTPENKCWRAAIDFAKPTLQCSLHGADIGGVFYVASRDAPDLFRVLQKQPVENGLTLSTAGEPFTEMPSYAPGIFMLPDFGAAIRKAQAAGAPPGEAWPAGNSSSHYATQRYSTFNLLAEVPLWDDARLRDTRISSFALKDIVAMHRATIVQIAETLGTWLSLFRGLVQTSDEHALLFALEEAYKKAPLERDQPSGPSEAAWSVPLPVNVHVSMSMTMRLANLRAFAMLAHLARLVSARLDDPRVRTAENAAEKMIDTHMRQLEREDSFVALPLDIPMEIQIKSILTAMRLLP